MDEALELEMNEGGKARVTNEAANERKKERL
jgi:hypothetical protein